MFPAMHGNEKMQNENNFDRSLNEKWAEQDLRKWYKEMADFTIFSNRALIKESKKCGVELEHVQHVSRLFFLKWDYNTDKQALNNGCL